MRPLFFIILLSLITGSIGCIYVPESVNEEPVTEEVQENPNRMHTYQIQFKDGKVSSVIDVDRLNPQVGDAIIVEGDLNMYTIWGFPQADGSLPKRKSQFEHYYKVTVTKVIH